MEFVFGMEIQPNSVHAQGADVMPKITKDELIMVIKADVEAGRLRYEWMGEHSFFEGDGEDAKCYSVYKDGGLSWGEFWALLVKVAKATP